MLCASLLVAAPALASAKTIKRAAPKTGRQGSAPRARRHVLSAVTWGTRMLKQGMSGTDVQTLQNDLTSLGWKTAATGEFNGATTRSVKDFQRKNKISVDGVVGPQTFKMLQNALGAVVEAPDASSSDPDQTVPADDSGGAGFVPADPDPSSTSGTTGTTGAGSASGTVVPGTLQSDGLATPGAGAPAVVQEVIAAANKIALDPYVYGGGHNDDWNTPQSGYDCSGSVSYALHGGGLLAEPLDSTQFTQWGEPGAGKWITIWADDGHAFMEVDGLFFDTVNQQFNSMADRWSTAENSWEKTQSYTEVHPAGW